MFASVPLAVESQEDLFQTHGLRFDIPDVVPGGARQDLWQVCAHFQRDAFLVAGDLGHAFQVEGVCGRQVGKTQGSAV
jgi:hypothetical protein